MPYSAEKYVKAFWRRIGAKDGAGYIAVKSALLELIAHGKGNRSYKEFCGFISNETKIGADYIPQLFNAYRFFLTEKLSEDIKKDIFLAENASNIKADYYDALCYSAGYIRRIMTEQQYTDDTNSRYKAVAFTGHRPEKMPPDINMSALTKALTKAVQDAIQGGYTVFYSGLSRGVDFLAADIVLKLKSMNPQITLVGAIPFKKQAEKWSAGEKREYERIASLADKTICISNSFSKGAYLVRNEYMVDNCNRLIAVYDNKSGGGTGFTVSYANKMGVEVVNINPACL